MMIYLILTLYLGCLFFIFLFSLTQLNLTWHYLRLMREKHADHSPKKRFDISKSPFVTIQLPVYNEKYVVERLIDAVCSFNYPREKLQFQLLDDSTDVTSSLIYGKVKFYTKEGFNIEHIQRKERIGFKAGALQYGLQSAKGDFLLIFDADFIPQPDFLLQTIPEFDDDKIGMVQTRWGHINENFSFLTKLQAFGLNAHFSVEQGGRSHAGSYINFNGTAGVWRKSCVIDAGGWSADTLTEDLDLSYRAQLNGWKFKYLEDIATPAELPVLMHAIKSQQYRWNKGAAETAKKHFSHILSNRAPLRNKIHAFFHLFNSTVFVCILVSALLSGPILFLKEAYPGLRILYYSGTVFFIGFLSIAFFYWIATQALSGKNEVKSYLSTFPLFLIVSMGLSLHNGIAVVEGLIGIKSPFVRTPKLNIHTMGRKLKDHSYVHTSINMITIAEGLLCLYFLFAIGAGIYLGDFSMLLFHLMLTLGFGIVFYQSVKSMNYVR